MDVQCNEWNPDQQDKSVSDQTNPNTELKSYNETGWSMKQIVQLVSQTRDKIQIQKYQFKSLSLTPEVRSKSTCTQTRERG